MPLNSLSPLLKTMPHENWMIALTLLVLISTVRYSIPRSVAHVDAVSIVDDEPFSSQAFFYGNGMSNNYPESTLRYVRVLFDQQANILHAIGWYFKELEDIETKKLLHFIIEPGKDITVNTISESGEPLPPLHLLPYGTGDIRVVWNAGTASLGSTPGLSNNLYQYIWQQNGSVSFKSLPPFPYIPNLSRIIQDSSGAIHALTFYQVPIDEANSFFMVRHIYENATEWREENFQLAMVSTAFQSVCYDAVITPNRTIVALLHCADLVGGTTWTDYLFYLRISDGNATAFVQTPPSEIRIHNVKLLALPDNSLIAVANINNRLAAGKFDVSGFFLEPIELAGISQYATEFECQLDSYNRTVIAYIAHEESYVEPGTLSILQESSNNEWHNSVVDSDHLVHSIWETREGWVDGWRGREGWSSFALDTSAGPPFLVFASTPTEEERSALKIEQKRICSLYLAQDISSNVFTNLEPKMLDLTLKKKGSFLVMGDWFDFLTFFIILCATGSFLKGISRRRRYMLTSGKSKSLDLPSKESKES
ncbi:MAG: hypothetical protein ACFFB3_23780 [Candidatus Hodarchaeota archaeon]